MNKPRKSNCFMGFIFYKIITSVVSVSTDQLAKAKLKSTNKNCCRQLVSEDTDHGIKKQLFYGVYFLQNY